MFTKFASACLVAITLATASLTAACSAPVQDVTADGADQIVSHSAHFETFVGKDGDHYFSLVAANGQNVLRSEGYTSTSGMKNGMSSVVSNGVDITNFDIREATNGEWYFNLKAQNHRVIGTSETYSTKSNATRGAKTVVALTLLLGATPEVSDALHQEQFEVFRGEDRKFYFHLRAGNGEIVLASQGYTTKQSAENGISSVETNGTTDSRYQVFETGDGQYAFHLKAGNGRIIARSESYVSESNAQRGVGDCASILGDRGIPVVTK